MMKRLHIWIVVLFLLLHITGAFAETIVIDDCGVCQGHVIVGTDRDGYDVELTKMLAEHYEEEEIIIGYDAVSITAGVHHIILDNVLIDVSDQENVAAFSIHPGAEVFLKLENESILLSGENCAGIQVPQGAKLCIMEESAGSLMAWGGQKGAGIGGGAQQRCGEIVISGGTIIAKSRDAYGNYSSAGIGGGMCGGYEHIAITGGTVYAEGYFIGIGGECSQTRGIIEISGGIVYAIGREEAVAIGNNAENSDGVILITGGVVYAQVDNYDWYIHEEAAMGCDHGTIRFDGGIVYANGSILLDAENAELIITDGLVSVNGQILERTDGK